MLQVEAEHPTLLIQHGTEHPSTLGDAMHLQTIGAIQHQQAKQRIKRNGEGDDAPGRASFSQEE
jgi:hypothetical protein